VSSGQGPATFSTDDAPSTPAADVSATVDVPDADGLQWSVGTMRVGTDALVDDGATGGYDMSQRRAGEGFAWIALDATATAGGSEVVLGNAGIRLVVDGNAIEPWTFFSEDVSAGTSLDVGIGFLVPADASSFELQLATADNPDAAASLTLDARPLLDQLGG
jgi:hypothetical protein